MILAPSRPSSSSLCHDVSRNDNPETLSPTSNAHCPTSGRGLASYRTSGCSWDEDVDVDDLTSAFLTGNSGDFNDVTPQTSSNGRANAQTTSPKRKSPHLFKQLANEFRWMHNNLKNGYASGTTPRQQQQQHDSRGYMGSRSAAATPQTTREEFVMPEDEELLTMSVRSSLRRNQSAPTSARDSGGKRASQHAASTTGSTRSQKTRWRTMENGEVEAFEAPQLPTTTHDPYAPHECRYQVRHPSAEEEERRSLSCTTSLCNQISPAEEPAEEVTMPDAYLSDSMLSDSDNENLQRGDSPLPQQRGADGDLDSGSSDLEAVATMGVCPVDRRLAKARRSSVGIVEEGGDTAHAAAAAEDSYETFLLGVAQLQRNAHQLSQHTSELRDWYLRERKARLRSKGKGQHLSWTRTVEAANTIQFWRMKVSLLRTFESLYVDTVQQLREQLPLIDPDTERTRELSNSVGVLAPLAQHRRSFLQSPRVITAQQLHLEALREQLKACWQANATLRDTLRQFEQRERRSPHDTFSVAGMDAEHFIASLPPRISALSLYSGSAKSSAHSLDSMDDAQAPRLLLTAQNLSPSEADDNDADAYHDAHCLRGVVALPNFTRPVSAEAPLVSCLKVSSASPLETSAATPPSSSKRLKYVIQSATFDAEDAAESTSLTARVGSRGSNGSRINTPLTGTLSISLDAQQRRVRERHVTFALEPEVLDARPRFSAHGRTIELLEQICMDKQAPWDGLTLLHSALGERCGDLAAMQDRAEDEQQQKLLARAVTMTPVCANAPLFRCEGGPRDARTRPQTAPSPTLATISTNGATFEKAKPRGKRSKVKPKSCAQCSVM